MATLYITVKIYIFMLTEHKFLLHQSIINFYLKQIYYTHSSKAGLRPAFSSSKLLSENIFDTYKYKNQKKPCSFKGKRLGDYHFLFCHKTALGSTAKTAPKQKYICLIQFGTFMPKVSGDRHFLLIFGVKEIFLE